MSLSSDALLWGANLETAASSLRTTQTGRSATEAKQLRLKIGKCIIIILLGLGNLKPHWWVIGCPRWAAFLHHEWLTTGWAAQHRWSILRWDISQSCFSSGCSSGGGFYCLVPGLWGLLLETSDLVSEWRQKWSEWTPVIQQCFKNRKQKQSTGPACKLAQSVKSPYTA